MTPLTRFWGALLPLAAILFLSAPTAAFADAAPTSDPTPANTPAIIDGNTLNARTLHIDNARVPGALSARQSVIAWQVVAGSWDGQALDGLSLVLVKTVTEGVGRQIDCYVSHLASLAQRRALVDAFLASQPTLLSPSDASHLHIEPGVITFQLNGTTITLHVGLVA